jgi:arylsulfate sulfotransferase
MGNLPKGLWCLIGVTAVLCVPAYATVAIVSMTPSIKSPQPIGTSITWTVTATDSNSGPLTFQFNLAPPGRPFSMVRDFNVGTASTSTWTSQTFVWTPTWSEGIYQIQVVGKDFASGETASKTVQFQVDPLVRGSTPVASVTANPMVVLFSAPSCPTASSMRVVFQQQSKATPATKTNWLQCHPPGTMNFEIAGMYPSTPYYVHAQTITGGVITSGPAVSFTTGALPANIPFPTFTPLVAPGSQTDTSDAVILHNLAAIGGGAIFPNVATDLLGKVIWYYYPNNSMHADILTRPLDGGEFLSIEPGLAWNPASQQAQLLRQIDLAGNIVRETNTGAIQQQLLALGARNGGPCNTIPVPAPVGSACLGAFHHDAIQTLPSGDTAVIADVEKIFPPGTQGDTTGLPVDIVGDMIIVLNANWQVVWYFDAFQHAGGGSQLNINRPAVLGDTCVKNQPGCPPMFLLGTGVAPQAKDWLHANTLYYWPQTGDIIWSAKNQDWVMKINYNNGSGNANILWRMGVGGDFAFNNIHNDPWPWFSHQHDAGIENNGAGPMTVFDNGNTRLLQLGTTGCLPADCNSRGMALTVDEVNMQVTPVLSADLGVFSIALGSAQLLSDGNYFFVPGTVLVTLNRIASYCIEVHPTAGTNTGTQVLNLEGPETYRAWRMPDLYAPPIT